MDILEKIIKHKSEEVAERKSLIPVKLLEKSIFFPGKTVSMKKYIQREDKSGIIAEFKRKSPSKGVINKYATVEKTSIGYMQAGASALSVLTDSEFFGGSMDDLKTARRFNFCPILRKEFIIDEYQIIEAKSIGADVILLIASALEPKRIKSLAKFAKSLGMEVLMEVHNRSELETNLHDDVDLIGVNNRNLKTFEVSIQTSIDLAPMIPDHYVKVAESGISDPASILALKSHGFEGFLIGETFMKTSQPAITCRKFIETVRQLEKEAKK